MAEEEVSPSSGKDSSEKAWKDETNKDRKSKLPFSSELKVLFQVISL